MKTQEEKIAEINNHLKRIKVRNCLKENSYYEYYGLENHCAIMVMWEGDVLKSIVKQVDKTKFYTFLCNGQAGKNSKQIYLRNIGE